MTVFDSNGNYKQSLQYSTNIVKQVVCSQNYLISLDTSGYLAINKYQGSAG